MLHSPRQRRRSIAAATLGALAILGSLLVATPAQALSDTGTGGVFVPATGRFLDTAKNIGGYDTPMPAKGWRTIQVTGKNGVPDDGSVGAVSVVATAASIPNQGVLYGRPNADAASTLMGIYGGDDKQNTSFSSVLAVDSDGTIQVQAETSIRLVLDVQGYYTASDDGTAAGGFVPLNGTRIADTRSGLGFPQQTIGAGERVDLQVSGRGGIPKGASGAIINMIPVNRTASVGYLTPYATGDVRPSNSFNYAADTNTSMQAQVKLSAEGKITIYNANSTIDLVIDTQGYFTAAGKGGAVFTPGAGRTYDTRSSGNTALGKNETRSIQIAGRAGVPVMGSGIKAVVLSLTSLKSTTGNGRATVWADGASQPNTTSINFDETTIRTNTITVPLGANGKIAINNIADGATNYVFDVQGWYTNPSDPTISCDSPFLAGAWVADAETIRNGALCTFKAPAASFSGESLDVTVNGMPETSFELSESATSTFSYRLSDFVGLVTIGAAVSGAPGSEPQTSYQFGAGAWEQEGLLPSVADGSTVQPEVALAPFLATSALFPTDTTLTYRLVDENTGEASTRSSANEALVPGAAELLRGHAYSWSVSASARNSWSSSATIESPTWRFNVAAEPEASEDSGEMSTFRASGSVAAAARPNGCTKSPDRIFLANFKPACDKHDICYSSGSRTSRKNCDLAFRSNLVAQCKKAYGGTAGAVASGCAGQAGIYYSFVRSNGKSYYKGKGNKS